MNNICCSLIYVYDLLIGFSTEGHARIGILISFELNHLSFLFTSLTKKNITEMNLIFSNPLSILSRCRFVGFKIHRPIGYLPHLPVILVFLILRVIPSSKLRVVIFSTPIPCLNHESCSCAFHWSRKKHGKPCYRSLSPMSFILFCAIYCNMSLPSFPLVTQHLRLSQKTHTQNRCDPMRSFLVILTSFTLITVLNKYRYNWYIGRIYPGPKQRPTV